MCSLLSPQSFFGSMVEKAARSICIDGMDANAFKVLLHFIYTDELLEMNKTQQ